MRRMRPEPARGAGETAPRERHAFPLTRRRLLIALACSPAAAMPALPAGARAEADATPTWRILDAVQRHLLPSEPDSPGAADVNALAYLRFVVDDPKVDAEERTFIVDGAGWLEDMAQQLTDGSFLALDENGRERVLRRIARSPAGERWLSTLIRYLMEALLTDPAYGGNPDGVGWRWLEHTPGFPRPPPDKIYPRLLP